MTALPAGAPDLAELRGDALDNMPVAVAIKDREGRFLYLNAFMAETLGVRAEDLIGTKGETLARDPEYDALLAEVEARAWSTGRSSGLFEEVYRGADGVPRRWLCCKTPIVDGEGNVRYLLGMGIDVSGPLHEQSALRRSRDTFRSVIDAIPARIGARDREGRYTLLNRYEAELLGVPIREALGRSPDELLPAMSDAWRETDREILEGRTVEPHVVETATAGAPARAWLTIKAPLRTMRGEIGQVLAVGIDVTEQRRLETRLRHAEKIETIGQLASGIAHDFNNMLSVILGNLELIRADSIEPQTAELLDVVLRAVDRAAGLTRRLLAVGRVQSLAPATLDVNELVHASLTLLRRTLGEAIEIEARLAEGPLLAHLDPAQLDTAILNLALNARDAMPKGGRLLVETQARTIDAEDDVPGTVLKPGVYVEIVVSDTGTGIAPDIVARVFEPFFTTKGAGEGTGLGLSMVHGFAAQSGGAARVYSEPGLGTTVRLLLPADPLGSPPDESDDLELLLGASEGEVVLVVEDDDALRPLTARVLADFGYEVEVAPDGVAALARAETLGRLDLLLTDIGLPRGMTGFDLAQALGQARPGLKILFMTGYAYGAVARLGAAVDEARIVRKPFRRADLARRVRRALDEG